MKARRLLILTATSLLAMTACTKSGGGAAEGGYIKDPTEIVIWTTYNDTYQAVLNNCIDEFKKMEPNVTVKNIKQNTDYGGLAKMVSDGFAVDNYPDMCAAYPDAANAFILNFKALNMEPYMNDPEIGWSEEDLNDIPEAYIQLGQNYALPGTYSLPASKSTEAMYYNQDKLLNVDLSGIDATINNGQPLNDRYLQNLTWEELFEKLVPALDAYDTAEKNAGRAGLIDKTTYSDWAWVGYDSDDNLFITLAQQYGYGYTSINQNTGAGSIDFNNQGMKDLMKKFVGYQKQHYFTTKGVIDTNVNYRSTVDAMMFSIGSTGGVKYQFADSSKHNVGVALIPQAAGKAKKVISQGPDFAFLDHKNENRAKATWLFFKLFTSTKYNTAWALASGYSPVRYSVMETEDYMEYVDYESKDEHTLDRLTAFNANYAAGVGDYAFTSAVFKGSDEARTQVGTIFAQCAASTNLDADIDGIFQTAVDNTKLKM